MRSRLVLAVLPVALVGVVALPSWAESKAGAKPVKGTFAANGLPDPSADAFETCQGLSPASRFEVPFSVPAAGKLNVELAGYTGDWDLALEDEAGTALATSAGFDVPKESIQVKLKKATKVVIVACNFVGGPSAAGSFTYTPAK